MSQDTQISPAIIRAVLYHAESTNVSQAARSAGISRRQIVRWQEKRERLGAQWPTDRDITEWRERKVALAAKRARVRALKAAERERQRLGVGPMHIDPTGTRRRLQGLFALGYTAVDLGRELNVTPSRVMQIATGYWKKVHVNTAARVKALCSRWWMTRPEGWKADRQRRWANQKGWLGLLAWDDDTIDDPNARPAGLKGPYVVGDYIDEAAVLRRMAGERVALTRDERIEVVRRLRREQWSYSHIEEHTGLKTDRYIAREKTAA